MRSREGVNIAQAGKSRGLFGVVSDTWCVDFAIHRRFFERISLCCIAVVPLPLQFRRAHFYQNAIFAQGVLPLSEPPNLSEGVKRLNVVELPFIRARRSLKVSLS